MRPFSHRSLAQRVVFGTGRALADLLAELDRLAPAATMLIGGGRAPGLVAGLAGRIDLRWDEVAQHVPVSVAERARAAAAAHRIDTVVAVGGGSAIGLAKAVALTRPVRIVAVPTTFAGSEATDVWGLTDEQGKQTGASDRVLPGTVIYDAELVASLPRQLAAASGLNALAHCVDALWAPAADPINTALATEAMARLADGLAALAEPVAGAEPLAARQLLQYGCYLAAVAFASAGSGLHHKICHVLGGRFGLPHAQTHAVVLPYVLAFNLPAAAAAGRRVATALAGRRDAGADPLAALLALRTALGAPRALAELGLAEPDLPAAVAAIAPAVPVSNPRPAGPEALRRLLHAAWAGTEPAALSTGDGPSDEGRLR
ncbi:MAG TPA: iron-containing alcohol dehydrogenase [Jatrophihabitans sp.]|nr:iron-containing alcohol dehydrogenase [Jatrophihabitans sp.]